MTGCSTKLAALLIFPPPLPPLMLDFISDWTNGDDVTELDADVIGDVTVFASVAVATVCVIVVSTAAVFERPSSSNFVQSLSTRFGNDSAR